VIVVVSATAAIAATYSGDGTFVGTSGSDTFNLGQGNDFAYGLGGKDTINAKNGNDHLDGDGHCMQGQNNQVYCDDTQDPGDQGNTINAGNGNDVIYAGGGHDTVNAGTGMDTIYGGPTGGDTINISGGTSSDAIHLGSGSLYTAGSTVNLNGGSVHGAVYAQNGTKDTINCFGSPATIYADKGVDKLNNCPNVKYTSPARDVNKRAAHRRHAKRSRHRRSRHAR
jgi:hypothetical protein